MLFDVKFGADNCWAEVSLIAIAIGFPINRGSGVRSHEVGQSLVGNEIDIQPQKRIISTLTVSPINNSESLC